MSPDLYAYLWVLIGVIVALIFPVLRGFVTEQFPAHQGPGMPPWLRRYLGLTAFSLVAALICLAAWKMQNPTGELSWFTAFLLGFGWQSAIEKIGRP